MSAKAKANAVQGLLELITIADNAQYVQNHKNKHNKDAKLGWYRYESKFALPVFKENGDIERYNVFCVIMLIRHAGNGKKYLYNMINIKKETSKLFRPDGCTQ